MGQHMGQDGPEHTCAMMEWDGIAWEDTRDGTKHGWDGTWDGI